MKVIYRPIALDEAVEAKTWYRVNADFGREFEADLEHAIGLVLDFPEIGSLVNARGARRLLLRRFPYAIFYWIRGHTMVVLAVFHASRNPRRLRGRLR